MSFADKVKFDLEALGDWEYLMGVDEVGWGSFAGDIYIGAVAVPKSFYLEKLDLSTSLDLVDDSKKVKEPVREKLASKIAKTFFYGIGRGKVDSINRNGMMTAYQWAFEEAVHSCFKKVAEHESKVVGVRCILDGNKTFPTSEWDHKPVVKGDSKSFAIGCASILAKVMRDAKMVELAKSYPHYAWEKNKGYGTPDHLKGIEKFGVCDQHREKFVRTYQNR
jgi:ribonuclease HII